MWGETAIKKSVASEVCFQLVINTIYGGFSISEAAWKTMLLYGYKGDRSNIPRHDPILVRVVSELGSDANGPASDLRIVKCRICYEILEDDGDETCFVRPQDLQTGDYVK